MQALKLPIGGFLKQSLIDFPGNIASVIFVRGCNMRCFYCHNHELVLPSLFKQHPKIPIDQIIHWIEKNANLLDAIVLTGGEPTIHPSLPDLLKILKGFSLKIKLDTNGTNSHMLEYLIEKNLIDYVAMDIKAPIQIEKYRLISGTNFSEKQLREIEKSIKILIQGKIAHEFRTTLNSSLNLNDIITILHHIRGNYYLQQLNTDTKKVINPNILGECIIDTNSIIEYSQSLDHVKVEIR